MAGRQEEGRRPDNGALHAAVALKILSGAGYKRAEGREWTLRNARIGVADANGRPTIRPQFIHVQPFRGGLARVAVMERRQLGTLGRWLKKLGLLKGRPLVVTIAKWGYIDRSGRWIWRPTR